MGMITLEEVKQLVVGVLQLGAQAEDFDAETQLLGAIPEFDSMAVVSVIAAIEDSFGLMVDDDEITSEVFETLGSLLDFINQKIAA